MQMRRLVTTVILCIGCLAAADAQTTFTQRIQQDNSKGGKMTITHSQAIDRLVNGANNYPTPSTAATTVTTPTKPAETTVTPAAPSVRKEAARTEPKRDTVSVDRVGETIVDTHKKVMKGGYKVTGFRVQAYAGGNQRKDRLKAEQVGNDIKAHFPDEPIYTHFYSPRWICRVGNYRTYEEAHEMLLNIRKLGYKSASIVKGKITVPYIDQ